MSSLCWPQSNKTCFAFHCCVNADIFGLHEVSVEGTFSMSRVRAVPLAWNQRVFFFLSPCVVHLLPLPRIQSKRGKHAVKGTSEGNGGLVRVPEEKGLRDSGEERARVQGKERRRVCEV